MFATRPPKAAPPSTRTTTAVGAFCKVSSAASIPARPAPTIVTTVGGGVIGRAICRCGGEETAAGHAWAGSAAFKVSTDDDVVLSLDLPSGDEGGERGAPSVPSRAPPCCVRASPPLCMNSNSSRVVASPVNAFEPAPPATDPPEEDDESPPATPVAIVADPGPLSSTSESSSSVSV